MKTVLITGAGGGIGRAITEKFIENGYFVIGQYNKNICGIESLKRSLEEKNKGDYFYAVQSDFNSNESIKTMMDNIENSFPHIDVLVNNAGIGLYKLITETTSEEWNEVMNVNLNAMFLITKRVLKGMIDVKKGKIVNISSMWGTVGASMEVCYSASKAGVIGFTKALAKEVGLSGINVNCVCPGVIDTPMNNRFSKEEKQALIDETPIGRMGKGKDIGSLVYFLSGGESDFITGQIITCDGGFTL